VEAILKTCEECGDEIVGGISSAIVCRGEWVSGKYARSECDKKRRRRNKNLRFKDYSGGGKYCAYELKHWIKNTCLKCGEVFNAESRTNKICYGCGLKNDELIGREVRLLI
jgi:hypothetical protein